MLIIKLREFFRVWGITALSSHLWCSENVRSVASLSPLRRSWHSCGSKVLLFTTLATATALYSIVIFSVSVCCISWQMIPRQRRVFYALACYPALIINHKFYVHQCQAQIEIWRVPDIPLTFTWASPDHLTIIWPSPDPYKILTSLRLEDFKLHLKFP